MAGIKPTALCTERKNSLYPCTLTDLYLNTCVINLRPWFYGYSFTLFSDRILIEKCYLATFRLPPVVAEIRCCVPMFIYIIVYPWSKVLTCIKWNHKTPAKTCYTQEWPKQESSSIPQIDFDWTTVAKLAHPVTSWLEACKRQGVKCTDWKMITYSVCFSHSSLVSHWATEAKSVFHCHSKIRARLLQSQRCSERLHCMHTWLWNP